MKICVCIKAVPVEYNLNSINEESDFPSCEEFQINPYDEYAVEEALLIAEKSQESEVILLSLGPPQISSVIKTALGMGGDRAIHIISNQGMEFQSFETAYAIKALIEELSPDLVLLGKESIDIPNHQMVSMIAQMLDWPFTTDIDHLVIENQNILVNRTLEKGMTEKKRLSLPALVSVTKGINEPRYPSFKNIMAAKKKEIDKRNIKDLIPETIAGNSIKLQDLVYLKKQNHCTFLEGDVIEQSDFVLQLLNYK